MEILIFALIASFDADRQQEWMVAEPQEYQPFEFLFMDVFSNIFNKVCALVTAASALTLVPGFRRSERSLLVEESLEAGCSAPGNLVSR